MTRKKLQYSKAMALALYAIGLLVIPVVAEVYSDSDHGWKFTRNNYRMDGYAYISWDDVCLITDGTVSTSIDDSDGQASVNGLTDRDCVRDDFERTWICTYTPAYASYRHIGPDPDGTLAYGGSSHSATDYFGASVSGDLFVDARP